MLEIYEVQYIGIYSLNLFILNLAYCFQWKNCSQNIDIS